MCFQTKCAFWSVRDSQTNFINLPIYLTIKESVQKENKNSPMLS